MSLALYSFALGCLLCFFGETRQVPQAPVRSLNATLNSTRMPFNSERFHFGKVQRGRAVKSREQVKGFGAFEG